MSEPERRVRTWREEPIAAVLSFLLVFVLVMFVGVSVLAGATDLEARDSALIIALPAAIIAAACAAYGPTRRMFSRW